MKTEQDCHFFAPASDFSLRQSRSFAKMPDALKLRLRLGRFWPAGICFLPNGIAMILIGLRLKDRMTETI